MKFISTLLFATAVSLVQNAVIAQTPTAKPAPANHAASAPHATATAARACAKVPDLSPKIPALPASAGCAKGLFTIKTVPNVYLTDISSLADPGLRDDLGIPTASTFTLAYIDYKAGTGELAAPHKWYSIQYTGYTPDGFKFDSSEDHPGKAPLTFLQGPSGPQNRRQVVVGMDTGVQGMRIGGKRRLFIPFELGYGPAGNPAAKIPPKSWLIFDIELVAQSDKEPAPKTPPTPPVPTSSTPTPAPAAKPATPPVSAQPAATAPGTAPASPATPASTPPATAPTATPPNPR
jgi:peptidylprolyl isomerase